MYYNPAVMENSAVLSQSEKCTLFDFGKDAFSTVEIELNTPFDANVEVILGEVAENGKIIHTPGYRTFIQKIIRTRTGKQVIKISSPGVATVYVDFTGKKQ